ncbi:MAG: sulfurtransferase complex subunit TusB [bacterium]
MAILHTVNKSPYQVDAFDACLRIAKEGAGVLLIEDGVYGALSGSSLESEVADAMSTVKVYVLGPDLNARGFNEDKVISGVEVVDYPGFVKLATEYDVVSAWL